MGKTYRKYGNQLCKSDSYTEDKNRGWRKKEIRSINHGIRNKNRGRDELDFINKPNKPYNEHLSNKSIVNYVYMNSKQYMNWIFVNSLEEIQEEYKWKSGSLREYLNEVISLREDNFYRICMKQLDRRNKIGVFKGHRMDKKK